MKKTILSIALMLALTGVIFAEDVYFNDTILPELREYAASILPADAVLLSIYPNTQETAEKLLRLRHGDHNLIIDERFIGPSKKPISAATIDAHKMHCMVSLTAKLNSYVRGEAYTIVYNDDTSSAIATEIASSIVFAETLRNTREELRLTMTYKTTTDNAAGYGVCFWLTAEKAPLDQEVKELASSFTSGNRRADTRTTTEGQSKSDIRKITQTETSNADVISSVQSIMASNERIQRFKEENKRLFGIDE